MNLSEIDRLDLIVEAAEMNWLADSAHWRVDAADQFDHMQAEAVVCARKGAGLVSVSTSRKRAFASSPRSAIHRARAERRADDEEAVYLSPDPHQARIRDLRRAVGFSARAHGVARKVPEVCKMLTLTYRKASDWQPNHISTLMHHVRKWSQRRGIPCRYVWVAELQQRGAIHYHIALFVPQGTRIPYPDEQGWWPHGATNLEEARAAVPYLMKYLSKGSPEGSLRLPQGARMYGAGGLEVWARHARRWLRLPGFVQARADISDRWARRPSDDLWRRNAGWLQYPRGEGPPRFWPAEYRLARCSSVIAFERVADHGRPFEADGPFSWLPWA